MTRRQLFQSLPFMGMSTVAVITLPRLTEAEAPERVWRLTYHEKHVPAGWDGLIALFKHVYGRAWQQPYGDFHFRLRELEREDYQMAQDPFGRTPSGFPHIHGLLWVTDK